MTDARTPRSQWLGLLLGPTLSLISFVLAYFVNPLNFTARDPLAAIPAFFLSVVVLLIGQNIATYREIERASGLSDRIYEAVKDYLHVTKVGSPEVAIEYVIARLPILREVRNTSFNIAGEVDRAEERFYNTDAYGSLGPKVAAWTARGGIWKDVVDPLAKERVQATIAQALKAAGKRRTGYQARALVHREPQVNFIVLSFSDGVEEVLFNWDYRSIGQDPTVLASRDRDIVHMFTVHFEQLWRVAGVVQDSSATRSTSVK